MILKKPFTGRDSFLAGIEAFKRHPKPRKSYWVLGRNVLASFP
jgi:hypothetical protein